MVWQGSAGDRGPYADQQPFSHLISEMGDLGEAFAKVSAECRLLSQSKISSRDREARSTGPERFLDMIALVEVELDQHSVERRSRFFGVNPGEEVGKGLGVRAPRMDRRDGTEDRGHEAMARVAITVFLGRFRTGMSSVEDSEGIEALTSIISAAPLAGHAIGNANFDG